MNLDCCSSCKIPSLKEYFRILVFLQSQIHLQKWSGLELGEIGITIHQHLSFCEIWQHINLRGLPQSPKLVLSVPLVLLFLWPPASLAATLATTHKKNSGIGGLAQNKEGNRSQIERCNLHSWRKVLSNTYLWREAYCNSCVLQLRVRRQDPKCGAIHMCPCKHQTDAPFSSKIEENSETNSQERQQEGRQQIMCMTVFTWIQKNPTNDPAGHCIELCT